MAGRNDSLGVVTRRGASAALGPARPALGRSSAEFLAKHAQHRAETARERAPDYPGAHRGHEGPRASVNATQDGDFDEARGDDGPPAGEEATWRLIQRCRELRPLSHEEAADLAKRVQAAIAAQAILDSSCGRSRSATGSVALTPRRRAALRIIRNIGVQAKRSLLLHNVPLVAAIAVRSQRHGLGFEDTVSEGIIGLLRAVEKFDPVRGYRFSTYASWWIRQSIQRGAANSSKLIRLPVHVEQEIAKLRAAGLRFWSDTTDEELSRACRRAGLTVSEGRQLVTYALRSEPKLAPDLDALDGPEEGSDPHEVAWVQNRKSLISAALDELSPQQAEVLRRRFGMEGFEEQTLEEVGRTFGLTRERIRQVQNMGLKRLAALRLLRDPTINFK